MRETGNIEKWVHQETVPNLVSSFLKNSSLTRKVKRHGRNLLIWEIFTFLPVTFCNHPISHWEVLGKQKKQYSRHINTLKCCFIWGDPRQCREKNCLLRLIEQGHRRIRDSLLNCFPEISSWPDPSACEPPDTCLDLSPIGQSSSLEQEQYRVPFLSLSNTIEIATCFYSFTETSQSQCPLKWESCLTGSLRNS